MGATCQRGEELKRNGAKYGGAEVGTITMCPHKDASEIENGWHLCLQKNNRIHWFYSANQVNSHSTQNPSSVLPSTKCLGVTNIFWQKKVQFCLHVICRHSSIGNRLLLRTTEYYWVTCSTLEVRCQQSPKRHPWEHFSTKHRYTHNK